MCGTNSIVSKYCPLPSCVQRTRVRDQHVHRHPPASGGTDGPDRPPTRRVPYSLVYEKTTTPLRDPPYVGCPSLTDDVYLFPPSWLRRYVNPVGSSVCGCPGEVVYDVKLKQQERVNKGSWLWCRTSHVGRVPTLVTNLRFTIDSPIKSLLRCQLHSGSLYVSYFIRVWVVFLRLETPKGGRPFSRECVYYVSGTMGFVPTKFSYSRLVSSTNIPSFFTSFSAGTGMWPIGSLDLLSIPFFFYRPPFLFLFYYDLCSLDVYH